MSENQQGRPGDRELVKAARAGIIAVVCWFFADFLSGTGSPTGLSLVFLLWLATFLAGATCILALSIGLWRRQQ